MEINTIRLNPFAVSRTLGAVAFLLALASIGGQMIKYSLGHDYVYGFVPLFYVDAEQNIPTLYSVLLLFFAAMLLTAIAVLKKKQIDPDASNWAALAFWLLFMAVDEASSIHEKLTTPVRGLLGDGPLGIFYYSWVIPGIVVVCMLTLYFLKFHQRLPAKTRAAFLVASAIFISGAIGFELVGGRYTELHGCENLTYSMIATAEESFEMAGVIVFIYALLDYIADHYKEIRFRLDSFE